eukprot:CFRG0657T1
MSHSRTQLRSSPSDEDGTLPCQANERRNVHLESMVSISLVPCLLEKIRLLPPAPTSSTKLHHKEYKKNEVLEAFDLADKLWYPARVLEVKKEKEPTIRVHYLGFNKRYDENIETNSNRLRALSVDETKKRKRAHGHVHTSKSRVSEDVAERIGERKRTAHNLSYDNGSDGVAKGGDNNSCVDEAASPVMKRPRRTGEGDAALKSLFSYGRTMGDVVINLCSAEKEKSGNENADVKAHVSTGNGCSARDRKARSASISEKSKNIRSRTVSGSSSTMSESKSPIESSMFLEQNAKNGMARVSNGTNNQRKLKTSVNKDGIEPARVQPKRGGSLGDDAKNSLFINHPVWWEEAVTLDTVEKLGLESLEDSTSARTSTNSEAGCRNSSAHRHVSDEVMQRVERPKRGELGNDAKNSLFIDHPPWWEEAVTLETVDKLRSIKSPKNSVISNTRIDSKARSRKSYMHGTADERPKKIKRPKRSGIGNDAKNSLFIDHPVWWETSITLDNIDAMGGLDAVERTNATSDKILDIDATSNESVSTGEEENESVGERENGSVSEHENGSVNERENGNGSEHENVSVNERENGNGSERENVGTGPANAICTDSQDQSISSPTNTVSLPVPLGDAVNGDIDSVYMDACDEDRPARSQHAPNSRAIVNSSTSKSEDNNQVTTASNNVRRDRVVSHKRDAPTRPNIRRPSAPRTSQSRHATSKFNTIQTKRQSSSVSGANQTKRADNASKRLEKGVYRTPNGSHSHENSDESNQKYINRGTMMITQHKRKHMTAKAVVEAIRQGKSNHVFARWEQDGVFYPGHVVAHEIVSVSGIDENTVINNAWFDVDFYLSGSSARTFGENTNSDYTPSKRNENANSINTFGDEGKHPLDSDTIASGQFVRRVRWEDVIVPDEQLECMVVRPIERKNDCITMERTAKNSEVSATKRTCRSKIKSSSTNRRSGFFHSTSPTCGASNSVRERPNVSPHTDTTPANHRRSKSSSKDTSSNLDVFDAERTNFSGVQRIQSSGTGRNIAKRSHTASNNTTSVRTRGVGASITNGPTRTYTHTSGMSDDHASEDALTCVSRKTSSNVSVTTRSTRSSSIACSSTDICPRIASAKPLTSTRRQNSTNDSKMSQSGKHTQTQERTNTREDTKDSENKDSAPVISTKSRLSTSASTVGTTNVASIVAVKERKVRPTPSRIMRCLCGGAASFPKVVQCHGCRYWLHNKCVRLGLKLSGEVDRGLCFRCTATSNPLFFRAKEVLMEVCLPVILSRSSSNNTRHRKRAEIAHSSRNSPPVQAYTHPHTCAHAPHLSHSRHSELHPMHEYSTGQVSSYQHTQSYSDGYSNCPHYGVTYLGCSQTNSPQISNSGVSNNNICRGSSAWNNTFDMTRIHAGQDHTSELVLSSSATDTDNFEPSQYSVPRRDQHSSIQYQTHNSGENEILALPASSSRNKSSLVYPSQTQTNGMSGNSSSHNSSWDDITEIGLCGKEDTNMDVDVSAGLSNVLVMNENVCAVGGVSVRKRKDGGENVGLDEAVYTTKANTDSAVTVCQSTKLYPDCTSDERVLADTHTQTSTPTKESSALHMHINERNVLHASDSNVDSGCSKDGHTALALISLNTDVRRATATSSGATKSDISIGIPTITQSQVTPTPQPVILTTQHIDPDTHASIHPVPDRSLHTYATFKQMNTHLHPPSARNGHTRTTTSSHGAMGTVSTPVANVDGYVSVGTGQQWLGGVENESNVYYSPSPSPPISLTPSPSPSRTHTPSSTCAHYPILGANVGGRVDIQNGTPMPVSTKSALLESGSKTKTSYTSMSSTDNRTAEVPGRTHGDECFGGIVSGSTHGNAGHDDMYAPSDDVTRQWDAHRNALSCVVPISDGARACAYQLARFQIALRLNYKGYLNAQDNVDDESVENEKIMQMLNKLEKWQNNLDENLTRARALLAGTSM